VSDEMNRRRATGAPPAGASEQEGHRRTSRRWHRVPFVLIATGGVLAIVLLLALGSFGPRPATTRPSTSAPAGRSRPAAGAGNWPAFQGGGALLGAAADAPAPPLDLLWTFKTDDGIEGSAAIAGGSAYVGDTDGTLYAVNLADGTERWRYKADGAFSASPLVRDGRVIIGDEDGVLHAVSTRTGRRLWRVETEGEIQSSANLVDGHVVVGSYDYHLYCVDPRSGAVVWKRETGNYVHCTPAVAAGTVYIAGCDRHLTAVDAATGDVIDTADLKAYAAAAPMPLNHMVVAATMDGRVIAFDRNDLSKQWEYTVEDGAFFGSPAFAEGRIVIGGRDGKVHAIDAATGAKAWTFPTKGDVDSSPVIAGGRVYVGSRDGTLYVLGLAAGRRLWSFTAGRQINGSPAVTAEVVVFGDTGGRLYCLGRRPVQSRVPRPVLPGRAVPGAGAGAWVLPSRVPRPVLPGRAVPGAGAGAWVTLWPRTPGLP